MKKIKVKLNYNECFALASVVELFYSKANIEKKKHDVVHYELYSVMHESLMLELSNAISKKMASIFIKSSYNIEITIPQSASFMVCFNQYSGGYGTYEHNLCLKIISIIHQQLA